MAQLVDFLLTAYMWVIIGRAVISWVSADPYNPIVRFLYEATEPVLSRIRGILPISVGGIDFSPVIVIMGHYLSTEFSGAHLETSCDVK